MTLPTQGADAAVPSFAKLPLDRLEVSRMNVRRLDITADLDGLAHSMDTFGLQQPIVVQPRGDKYEILIGQRRYLAAKRLGWREIDAKILPQALGEFDAKVRSFSENAQRRDLTPRDKADACRYLHDQLGSVKAVADTLGISEPTVRKWLGYSVVPEGLKSLVDQGRISAPVATRIAQYQPDEAQAVAIAEKMFELNPSKDERDRLLDAVEAFPDTPVDMLKERADSQKVIKEIRFVLPERWARAIDNASRALDLDSAEIAKDATIEWLSSREY